MTHSIRIRRLPATLALVAVAALGLVLAVAGASGSEAGKQRAAERLVVRGEDTVKDGPCPGGVCKLELTDGVFRRHDRNRSVRRIRRPEGRRGLRQRRGRRLRPDLGTHRPRRRLCQTGSCSASAATPARTAMAI